MNNKVNNNKSDFVNLFLSTIESDSRNKEAARVFLTSEGLDPDRIVSEGMKRIKQMQMMIEARKTEQEMIVAESVKQMAVEWVDNLLKNINFSLPALVQQEGLTVSFRNVETLNTDDIRNILIRHFTLKFMKEQESNHNDL